MRMNCSFNITQTPFDSKSGKEVPLNVQQTAKLVACLFLGVLGIFGNVFAIFLVAKIPIRKGIHFLITNIAVGDALFILLGLFKFVFLEVPNVTFWKDLDPTIKRIIYPFWSFLSTSFATQTLLSLMIISIERYRATRQRIRVLVPSRRRRKVVLAASWVIVSIMSLSTALTLFFYITLVITYYLTMVTLSILALRNLSKQRQMANILSEIQRKRREKQNRNAVKLVLYSLLYSCCYGPWIFYMNFVIAGVFHVHDAKDWLNFSFVFYYFLPFVNSCLSPFIYCACMTDFRHAARRLIWPETLRNTVSDSRGVPNRSKTRET